MKMKTSSIYMLLLVLGLTLGSCKKYLDIKMNSTEVRSETAEDCQLILDNYAVMNTGYPSDGEFSADDYVLINNTYTNLNAEKRGLHIWSATAKSSSEQWINPYKVVFRANLVLETLEKLQGGGTDPVTLNTLKGSALFFRAYAFWNLAQLYSKPYTAATAGQDLGIPLRTSTDLNDKFGRGTVQETYDRIAQDLQDAVNLLPATSSIVTRPNKAAAYAMLARTRLSMEDYPAALAASTAALQLKSDLLDYNVDADAFSNTPFYPRFNKEVIFHSVTRDETALQPRPTTAWINPELTALYEEDDLRKSIFFKPVGGGNYRFTGSYEGGFLSAAFFNGLAVDELYLIRAECYARSGQVNEAMADLNTLLLKRWNNAVPYPTVTAGSPAEALSIIIRERRKELVMRAQRWTDLRRLNKDPQFKKDLVRKLAGSEEIVGTLPANDLRYVLLIAEGVISNSGLAQNPR